MQTHSVNHHKQKIKDRIIELWGREPQTLDELAYCIIAVLNQQPAERQYSNKPRKNQRRVQVAGLSWDIRFSETISNTHECPINGVTNWGNRNKGAPTYYPGWSGRVWVRYAKEIDGFSNDPWPATLTYPGTGGFGGYSGPWEKLYSCWYKVGGRNPNSKVDIPEPRIYSWDYRFFQEDWPELAAQRTWDILTDNTDHIHRFRWEDPEIVQRDQEFLKKYGERHYAV